MKLIAKSRFAAVLAAALVLSGCAIGGGTSDSSSLLLPGR
jgi:PBP1b-binding outer membrane lipoprotein LpoB